MTSLLCFVYKTLRYICDILKQPSKKTHIEYNWKVMMNQRYLLLLSDFLEICEYSLWIYRDMHIQNPLIGLDLAWGY